MWGTQIDRGGGQDGTNLNMHMTGWCPLQSVAALWCCSKIERITKQVEFPLGHCNHRRHFHVGGILPPCSLTSSLSQHQQQPSDGNGHPNYIQYEQQEQRDFPLHSVAGSLGDPSIVSTFSNLSSVAPAGVSTAQHSPPHLPFSPH